MAEKAGAELSHREWLAYLRAILLPSPVDRAALKQLGGGLRHHRALVMPVKILHGTLVGWLLLSVSVAAASIALE